MNMYFGSFYPYSLEEEKRCNKDVEEDLMIRVIWDSYKDNLITKYELVRSYMKNGTFTNRNKLVAKGITAYLAHNNPTSFRTSILLNNDLHAEKVSHLFFPDYFVHCLRILNKKENRDIPIDQKLKSGRELILMHLENELQLFQESQMYYSEIISQTELKVIEKIKDAALNYPNWVRIEYLNEPTPKIINNIKNETIDFYSIIYEAFNHISAPTTFFKNKRKECKCIKSEYAEGLREAFKMIANLLDSTDYFKSEFINENGKIEYIDLIRNEAIMTEQIVDLQKRGEISFPFKINIDLSLKTNGAVSGILTAERLDNLWHTLSTFLDSLYPITEKTEGLSSLKTLGYTENSSSRINMFCESMPFTVPIDHFKYFTNNKSSNGNFYLTEDQLNIFIERAFCDRKDLPKQKFNQTPKGEKLLIQNVFYDFYLKYSFLYFNSTQNRDIFISLLTDNFDGWDFDNVKSNFKPQKITTNKVF